MTDVHNRLRRIAASVTGLVFFVSGMLKLMDPVGAKLVVSEYFSFFGLEFMDLLSAPVAVFMALLETFTGVALVTGVFRRLAAAVTGVLLSVFTVITAILLIANPEMDCGCFGEAVHLTHLQTFLKNVALCLLAAFAFIPFRDYGVPRKRSYVSFSLVTVFSVFVLVWSSVNQPLTDFTPFRLSSVLAAADNGDGDADDIYVATYIYSKNGQEGVFTLDNLPDSTWTFVRTETIARQDNITPSGSPSLSIYDNEGYYHDELAASGHVMVVSVYDVTRVDIERWQEIARFITAAETAGFTPLLLTAPAPTGSGEERLMELLGDELASILAPVWYQSDFKTLVSLNRSNGGVSCFMDGQLIRRWGRNFLPDDGQLSDIIWHDSIDLMLSVSTEGRLLMQASFLYSLALMLLL